MQELQAKLRRSQRPGAKGKGYTQQSLIQHARQICSGQYMAQLLHVSVSGEGKHLQLSYRSDAAALAGIEQQPLGKRILFTDRQHWSKEQIVLAYRSQSHVEDAFADMKDPHFLSGEPMFHCRKAGYSGSSLRSALALAERVCRAADRVDTARMSGSRDRL